MNRIFTKPLGLTLAAALGIFGSAAFASGPALEEVKASAVNVRSAPSTSSRIVTVLKKHRAVKVVERKGVWRRIDWPVKGWVNGAYLRYGLRRYVKADSLNVRKGPGKSFGVVKRFKQGTAVRVVQLKGHWRRIDRPVNGWVHGKYIGITATPKLGPRSAAGFVNLPSSGYGWHSVTSAYRRWGKPRMIMGLITMGRRWKDGYPGSRGHVLVYSDISLKNGGYFSPHVSHRLGVDVDVLPITTSGSAGYTVVGYRNYSTWFNQKYVYLIRSTWSVQYIFHNNSRIRGVSYWQNHANHLHIRIY